MKKIVTLAFMLTALFSVNAQDIITKKDGSDVAAKNLEIGKSDVKFQKTDIEGLSFTEPIADILMIRLEKGGKLVNKNGVLEYVAPTVAPSVTVTPKAIAKSTIVNNSQSFVATPVSPSTQQPMETMTQVVVNTKSTENSCDIGVRDSRMNYTGQNSGKGGVLAASLLFPLAGLSAALFTADRLPKDNNLSVPNFEMLKNQEYMNCYRTEALKTKKKKIWNSFFIGAGIYLVSVVILNSAGN